MRSSGWLQQRHDLLCCGVLCFAACRLIVLRLLSGLLFVMLGTMLVRYVVWLPVWLATGAHFWILPNLMSETVSAGVNRTLVSGTRWQYLAPACRRGRRCKFDASTKLIRRRCTAASRAAGVGFRQLRQASIPLRPTALL